MPAGDGEDGLARAAGLDVQPIWGVLEGPPDGILVAADGSEDGHGQGFARRQPDGFGGDVDVDGIAKDPGKRLGDADDEAVPDCLDGDSEFRPRRGVGRSGHGSSGGVHRKARHEGPFGLAERQAFVPVFYRQSDGDALIDREAERRRDIEGDRRRVQERETSTISAILHYRHYATHFRPSTRCSGVVWGSSWIMTLGQTFLAISHRC